MKLFCSASRGNTVHRYDLQLKGPKEETFGPEALCQRGSLQAARVHVNCPVSASAAARSTPSSVTDVPAHASPKDFEGCVLCPLFVAVPVFASSRSGPCKGCKLHSSVSVCLSVNRLLSTASTKHLLKAPAAWKCLPLKLQAVNHFPRKQTQRNSPPVLLSGVGTEMPYGISLCQHVCVTQVTGATEAFLKWYNMSKTVECVMPQPTKPGNWEM